MTQQDMRYLEYGEVILHPTLSRLVIYGFTEDGIQVASDRGPLELSRNEVLTKCQRVGEFSL